MITIGLNWPLAGFGHDPLPLPVPETVAEVVAACGVQSLRFNAVLDSPHVDWNLCVARDATAVEPLVILDLPYPYHRHVSLAIDYATFCAETVSRLGLKTVEILNEPAITSAHKLNPDAYAFIARGACEAIRYVSPETTILLAGDILRSAAKKGERADLRWNGRNWFEPVRQHVPRELYDGVSIHPYRRSDYPPMCSPYDERELELGAWIAGAGTDQLWVTEVGWEIPVVTEEQQARFLVAELAYWRQRALSPCVYIYAHAGSFGLCTGGELGDYHPRPAAHAVRRFIEGVA